MNKKAIPLAVVAVIALGLLYWVFGPPAVGNPTLATDAESIARGAYAYNAAGCGSCHQPEGTTAPVGGYEIESPFGGTFHVPNITPDEETGIGGWTGKNFLAALKHGRSPGGGFYWPAFPYRSYKDMTDQDVLDIGAYLMSLEPVRAEVPAHELPAWQFSWMMAGWNILADFMEGTPPAIPEDPQVQRGAYLARVMGHCGECHTPRNSLGMMQLTREFEGSDIVTAQLTPAELAGWTEEDFMGLLQLGMTASFDFVGGEMAEVIKHTSALSLEDQEAYTAFFTREPE